MKAAIDGPTDSDHADMPAPKKLKEWKFETCFPHTTKAFGINEDENKCLLMLEKSLKKLTEKDEALNRETAARKILQQENKALRKELGKFMELLGLAESEKKRLTENLRFLVAEMRNSDHGGSLQRLQSENRNLYHAVSESEKKILGLAAENRRLSRQLAELSSIQIKPGACRKDQWTEIEDIHDCTCSFFDLCRKRVLIIGSQEAKIARYREVIEGNRGILEYHNAEMMGGSIDLEKSVKCADVILCPVDCNSIDACKMVKKICTKYGKPFQMIPSSGTNTIFKAVFNKITTIN